MNENGISWRPRRCPIAVLAMWGLTGLMLFGANRAEGASTKRFVLTPQEARTFQVWSNYLAKGPQTWSTVHAPPFTPAIRSTIWQVLKSDTQAQQLTNPMIDYLLWRQSINPTRFATNHPHLSPALTQLLNSLEVPSTIPPPAVTPPQATVPQGITPPATLIPPATQSVPPTTQSVSPQSVMPPAVPEPGSLVLAAGMIGWGVWWARRSRQSLAR
jgi:hypothetical protein